MAAKTERERERQRQRQRQRQRKKELNDGSIQRLIGVYGGKERAIPTVFSGNERTQLKVTWGKYAEDYKYRFVFV